MRRREVVKHVPWTSESLYHYRSKAAGTTVLEKPDAEEVISAYAESIKSLSKAFINIKIGTAFLHPKDQLKKKEGRKIASQRMDEVKFEIEKRSVVSDHAAWFTLMGVSEKFRIHYQISVKIYRDSRKLRVMNVFALGLDNKSVLGRDEGE